MEKITKREMFEALVSLATTGKFEYETTDGVVSVSETALKEFAENEIALLDKKAVKAKERASAKKAEADELTEVVFAAMTEEFEPIAEIASRIEGEDVTVAKVQYRLRKLAEAGRAEKTELTIPATEGGKARKVVGYKKIAD